MGFFTKLLTKSVQPPTFISNPIKVGNPLDSLDDPLENPLIESFVKHVFCKQVKPILGSIIKVDLALSQIEHTGIYVGGGKIVELNGDGEIRKISYDKFISSSIARTGISAYVACNESGYPLGDPEIANRALSLIDTSRNYNLILDNCHQFTSGAITGRFENFNNFFTFLEKTIKKELNNGKEIKWLVWDR